MLFFFFRESLSLLIYLFRDRVSSSPGGPETWYAAENNFKLIYFIFLLLSSLLFLCVHMCVHRHGCMGGGTCAHMHRCVWKLEVYLWCFPQSLSPWFLGIGPDTEPGACWFILTGWPTTAGIFLPLSLQCLDYRKACSDFLVYGCKHSNSGHHTYMASPLLAEQYPSSYTALLVQYQVMFSFSFLFWCCKLGIKPCTCLAHTPQLNYF